MLKIRLLRYHFVAPRPLRLNMDLPAITLRGAFGYALHDLLRNEHSLPDPLDRWRLFLDLFSPTRNQHAEGASSLPRPFVIRGGFLDDDRCQVLMELLLFGEAAYFESLANQVIEAMACRGLGDGPDAGTPCDVQMLYSETVEPDFSAESDRLVVDFVSPARIRYRKHWLFDEIPFVALISRLTDRFSELVQNYGRDDGRDWAAWTIDLKHRAADILSMRLDGENFRGRRISTRTGASCALNGFVGQMLYQGIFTPFSEILSYLPFIHVGKSAPFGCGWCCLEYDSTTTGECL